MTSSTTSMPAPSLAQPTINAIQQQITALLPSTLASAITAQFAGGSSSADQGSAPVQPSTVGATPAMMFSLSDAGSDAGSPPVASLAQPTIDAIQQQIAALLPSDLASAITSQFAGASPGAGEAVLPTPSAASAALTMAFGDQASLFLPLPSTT